MLAVLAPAEGTHTATNISWITSTEYSASAFDLNMQNGSFNQSDVKMSFDSSSAVYLDKVLPTDSKATTRAGGTSALYYVYSHFRKSSDFRSKIATAAGTRAVYVATGSFNFTSGSTSFSNTLLIFDMVIWHICMRVLPIVINNYFDMFYFYFFH